MPGPRRPRGEVTLGQSFRSGGHRLGAFTQGTRHVGVGDVLGGGDDSGDERPGKLAPATGCADPTVDATVQGRGSVPGGVQLASLNKLREGRGDVQAAGLGVPERSEQGTVGLGLAYLVGLGAGQAPITP